MVLAREAAVRLLDLGVARLAIDTENLVGILRGHPRRYDTRRAPRPERDVERGTITGHLMAGAA